jgi:diguanylate cyclase (GGDEF)-like protein
VSELRPGLAEAPSRGDEDLCEDARRRRPKRPGGRDLWTSLAVGGAFLAAAAGVAALLPWQRTPSVLLVGALIGAYALLSRVEFEVGPGSVVPTQLVFVPMLFALPLPLVPLCVAAGYVLGALPEYFAGRVHPARVLVLFASSWFAIGPTLVLALFATDTAMWRHAPVYIAALTAQFLFDFVSSAARERLAFGHSLRALAPAFAWVYAVDACLAAAGLGAVIGGTGAFLVMFPLAGLFALLARERRVRIDRAVAFDRAYRGALNEAHRDELTGLANRRKLMSDLEGVFAEGNGDERVLIIYDLNGFKYYNDIFGHPAGDALLRRLADKLARSVDERGTSYRLGGDEFCVFAAVPVDEVAALLDATTVALSEEGDGFSISTCFGAVFIPSEADDFSAALRLADQRLYAQKHGTKLGRDRPHEVLLEALCERDPELRNHVQSVAHLCTAVGMRLGVRGDDLEELIIAAQLHDVGKIGIPDAVLHKPGPLDEGEWALIRQHTLIGQRILGAAPALHRVGMIVRTTHERWDGTGYVDGLASDAIPLAARIIAVCDAFAAMTSHRPYREAMTLEQALAELRRCAGTQFDPDVVRVFCDEVASAKGSRLLRTAAA